MDWSETIVGWLAGQRPGPTMAMRLWPASRPRSTAMALVAHGRDRQPPLDWLVGRQADDGSVGSHARPGNTRLAHGASGAGLGAGRPPGIARRRATSNSIARATDWLLTAQGMRLDSTEQLGHDSTLIGWPWVEGTHSWIEPTAWAVLALKRSDYPERPHAKRFACSSIACCPRGVATSAIRLCSASSFCLICNRAAFVCWRWPAKRRRPAHRPHRRLSRT